MGMLLMVTGAIWSIIGLGNIIGMPWAGSSKGVLTFGFMLNMLLFILPGLIVCGIGVGIKKRKSAPATEEVLAPKKQSNIEERLNKLADLKEKGLIDGPEYESRRTAILKEI